jgi:hypothetical protein
MGAPSSLTATLDADLTPNVDIPTADRPPSCFFPVTRNCLQPNDVETWDRLYASALGLVDSVASQVARSSSLSAEPLGTPLVADTTQWAPYFYAMDTWRVARSLTLNYGLTYGWQTPPSEQQGRQTVVINTANGQEIAPIPFLNERIAAASQGQIYNPQIAYLPVNSGHLPLYKIDRTNLAPRAGLAWHLSFNTWLLRALFGSNQSVLRLGAGIYYDRTNTVQDVTLPMLGGGFGQVIAAQGPLCNASGAPGPSCTASSLANPALSSFRVGQDGQIPIPGATQASNRVVPSTPLGEVLSFADDPDFKTGRSYEEDLTIQRQFGPTTILEAAAVVRMGRDLPESVNLDQAPYFMFDPSSGQTFAQAYEAVARELRNGQPVTPQPWFEDLAPKIVGTAACPAAATSSTACLATRNTAAFLNGLVSSLFNAVDTFRATEGLPAIVNQQTEIQEMRTYEGRSNYQGFMVTLRKQMSSTLSFQLNYTRSKALDNGILNQGSASYYGNGFYPNSSYGLSPFDEKNVITADFVYALPFGQGHRFHFRSKLDQAIRGWSMSGIFTRHSGLPLTVAESTQAWGNGLALGPNTAAITPLAPLTELNPAVLGSGNIASNGNPATGGTGMNIFSDPVTTYNDTAPINLSTNGRDGSANALLGLPYWNLDYELRKQTPIGERLKGDFSVEFFNLLNHPNFSTPSLSLTSPESFGVISSTLVPPDRTQSSRWIELTFRLEF